MKSNDLSVLARGPEGEALEFNKELLVTVHHETYEGKTRAKIKWINLIGGDKFKSIAVDEAKRHTLNLNGFVAQRRQQLGIKTKTTGVGF